LKTGQKKFEPGVLAEANGNLLYVDEVNLLEDHLVDLLLDAAAMGINIIEREGISFAHPSRFILIGTMNPEEGDLRPQLLDRFGLVVDVKGEEEIEARVEVVKRRMAFESDPAGFIAEFGPEQKKLSKAIGEARKIFPGVQVPDERLDEVARVCIACGVDGHRADITIIKAAAVLAALEGKTTIGQNHCVEAACLALPHRMRRRPFEEGYMSMEDIGRIFAEKSG
ncbi:MAG: magnesium chelatase ATPase subunit I, partial [Spirochaetales bacterium]